MIKFMVIKMAEYFLHKGSPTYLQAENADVMSISQFMAQNLRQHPPSVQGPSKHTFEISEGESVEIEKIVAAEKKEGQLYYKVKWVKYTWEAEESIQHLPHLIDGYWREHFYQNINQAAIDTTALTLVNENDYDRGKTVVINAVQDDPDAQKAASTGTAGAANVITELKISPDGEQDQLLRHQDQLQQQEQIQHDHVQPQDHVPQQELQQQEQEQDREQLQHQEQLQEHEQIQRQEQVQQEHLQQQEQIQQEQIQQQDAIHNQQELHQQQELQQQQEQLHQEHLQQERQQQEYSQQQDQLRQHHQQALVQVQAQGQVIDPATATVTSATLGENNDVILELSMPNGAKVDHVYQSRLAAFAAVSAPPADKKQRRAYPMERKYLCNVCQKTFDRNTSLTRHMLVHTREKPFKCQLCDKAFSQNAHLKRHILIHIGQKSYQCNKCGKMFIEKGGLARHEATHSTEKPWVCNQCGKSFVLNEYLQRHLFLHTGQKPYQCNDCGRLFADGSSWRAHKLTHIKEKKYKCHICNKMLKCKRNYKKHVAAHADEKQLKYRCDICDERFPNKKTMKEHLRRARRNHRCRTCGISLKTREKYQEHMATHDPNSATYNPNVVVRTEEDLGIEEREVDKSDAEEVSDDEDDDDPKTLVYSNIPDLGTDQRIGYNRQVEIDISRSDNGEQRAVGEEEILGKILSSGKDKLITHTSATTNAIALASHPSLSAPRIFTTFILKSERSSGEASSSNQPSAVLVSAQAPELLHGDQVANFLQTDQSGNIIHTQATPAILHAEQQARLQQGAANLNILASQISSATSAPDVLTSSSLPATHVTSPITIPTFIKRPPPSEVSHAPDAQTPIEIENNQTSASDIQGKDVVQGMPHTLRTDGNIDMNRSQDLVSSEVMADGSVDADVAETIILITQTNGVPISSEVRQV